MRPLRALLASCVVAVALVALPAERGAAHVEISDPIILPQTGSGDVVRLPGQPVLAIAGGNDSPVVFVDLSDRSVTVVPESVGVLTLDLDDDGTHLHGVSRTPYEVVEIDVATAEVARRWPVPDACLLTDTVMRGGFLWVAQGCGDSRLQRLHPTTGDIAQAAPDLDAQSLVGEPGSSRFYTFWPSTSPVLTRQDASPTGLVELGRREPDLYYALTGDIHLSEDGGTLFVPNHDGFGGPDDAWTWTAPDLGHSGTWDVSLLPLWADANYIGVELPQQGVPALVTREDQQLVNTFLPNDVAYMSTSDIRRVGEDLVITGFAGGEKRVYIVADPLVEEPQLTINVPWGHTGVHTPTPLTGSASSGGQPLAGRELQLIEVGPTRRVLGTVVTNEAGEWTYEWTPDTVGMHVLEIRHRGARDSVDRVRVSVEEVYERLDLSGPSVVAGGDDIVMTATVTRNGQPLPDITVNLERQDWAKPSYFEFEELGSVTTNEAGIATFTTPPGAVNGYWYYAEAMLPYEGRFRTDGHRVEVTRTPTTVTIEPEVTTAVPGDPVPIHVSLTTGDGQPVQGEPVRITLRRNEGGARYATVTTDADGTATYLDTTPEEGRYELDAFFGGTLVLKDAAAYDAVLQRKRIATTVVVNGATTGEVGVPVELAGQVTGVDGPVELTITDDSDAKTSVTTDVSGAWTATVTPTLPGANYWRLTFAGTTRLAPSAATHQVQTPRLETTIEVESVKAQVGQWLEVTGKITGLTHRSGIHFWFDDEPVGTRYTDSTFSTLLTGPLQHAGPAQLVISYWGDARHEPASVEITVDVERAPSTLELAGSPFVDAGDSFDVSGTVVPAVNGEVMFSVVDPNGDKEPVTVNVTDGHFVLPLHVPATVTSPPAWDVTFPGTNDYAAVTTTYEAQLRGRHPIHIGTSPTQPPWNGYVDLHLEPPFTPSAYAELTVANRFGRELHRWEGTVDVFGRLLFEQIRTAWRVTLTLREDDQHLETTHEILVRPKPRMYDSLLGGDFSRRTSPYYVFDEGEVPELLSVVAPRDLRGCLTRVVQRRVDDGWRTIDKICLRFSGERLRSRINGVGRAGVKYRVRTTFDGNRWYPASRATFRYFRFRA